jgi:hypothetical protein
VPALIDLAVAGRAVAYEALQILCYRNSVTCNQICTAGIGESRMGARPQDRPTLSEQLQTVAEEHVHSVFRANTALHSSCWPCS